MNTRLFCFGPPRIEQAGELLPLHLQKALALLTYLVVDEQPHTRDALATMLWPDYDQSGGRGRLRRTLYELNNALTTEILLLESDMISLDPEADVWVDVAAFRKIVAEFVHGSKGDAIHADEEVQRLEQAAALYTDDFLSGFSLPDAPAFEDWRFFLAEELKRSLAELLVQLAEANGQRGQWEQAIPFGRRWLALDPLHEPAHQLLMRMYASTGHIAAAVRQYERCVEILQKELGTEPAEETTALYEAIRTRRFKPPGAPKRTGRLSPRVAAERYVRHERLFSGGHADVFRGEDLQSGDIIAIKRLNARVVSNDAELVARFVREGELLQQLNHPNIIRMLDVVEEDGQQSIIMEYVDGGSLRDLLDSEGALAPDKVLDIALPLADALVLAHKSGVIHRDLKPDNVLLDKDGRPKLTDFGLARLLHGNVHLTQHGAFLGTLAYMSPEAINGEVLDARSDIWSFGVMLYEMLAGERPFSAEPVSSLLSSILYGPLPDLALVRPDVQQPLTRLLNLILVRERERRLPSMRRLGAILEAIRNGDGVHDLLQVAASGASDAADQQQATPSVRHKLPARAAPFIGRDEEMATVTSFLNESQTRLLTILGPGGMGKTRLALAAARQFAVDASAAGPVGGGLYFVPLAPLDNAEKIVQAIADVLDLAFETTATAARTPRRQLLDFLADRRLLLILDNFEHLLDGVSLVGDILRQASGVKIVVTSQERLNLREEHVLALRGLQHPLSTEGSTTSVGNFEAVRLFIQSARRTRPDFVLTDQNAHAVAEICRLVEGMPLAVELTSAWLDVLPVVDVAEEVQRNLDFLETDKRDVPPRQRSIRAVFETTWQRLDEKEQAAFARLSVFRGGFERSAAVEINHITLRMLRHLVGKALLQYDSAVDRYQIHDLLRQYAMQKLEEEGGADEVLDRHSAHFCAALQRWQAEIEGSNKRTALAAIERDVDNIFAAWRWALAHGQVRRLDQAMHSLEHFFYWRSRIHEAEAFYGDAAAQLATRTPRSAAGETEHQCAVAALQARHANFGYLLQNWDEARDQFQASLTTYEELEKKEECDVRREKAYILMKMGDVTRDLQEAQSHFEQSLALYEAVGHHWWAAGLHCHLGYVALAQGRYEEAGDWFEKSLALYRELDDRWQFGWVLDGLSNVALYQQDLAEAEKLAQESLAIHREIGLRDRIADNLTTLCWIALAQGKQEAAQAYRQEAMQIWQALGLEERINLPLGLEDQPFTPRWFSGIIDQRMGTVIEQSAHGEKNDA